MIYFVGLGKLPKFFSKSNLNVLINFTFLSLRQMILILNLIF